MARTQDGRRGSGRQRSGHGHRRRGGGPRCRPRRDNRGLGTEKPDASDAGSGEDAQADAGVDSGTGSGAGADSGPDTGTPPSQGGPCVQTVGGVPADHAGNTSCIKCDQNTNSLCDGTQAIIVTRDIEEGLVSGGVPTAASCYECMVKTDNLDSTKHVPTQTGLDCETAGVDNVQACLDTLNCEWGSPQSGTAGTTGTNSGATSTQLASDCANAPSGDGVYNCFCGSNEMEHGRLRQRSDDRLEHPEEGAHLSPNGVCAQITINGLAGDTTSTSNTQILFTDLSTRASRVGLRLPDLDQRRLEPFHWSGLPAVLPMMPRLFSRWAVVLLVACAAVIVPARHASALERDGADAFRLAQMKREVPRAAELLEQGEELAARGELEQALIAIASPRRRSLVTRESSCGASARR